LAVALAGTLTPAEKPTPRQKAKELLDSAAGMAAAVSPDNATVFHRGAQADIAVMLAAIDPSEAVGLLKQIQPPNQGYDNRSYAASRVIDVLLEKDQMGAAMALAEYMGGAGAYPVVGVNHIIRKLPEGDPQRAALFSAALSAYTVKPDRGFHDMLMRYHKELPPGMAQTAVGRIVSTILDRKDDGGNYQPRTYASAKGTVSFTNRQDSELFDFMPLVREVGPKRYEELVANRVELRSALGFFPGGGPSVADDRGITIYSVSSGPGKAKADAADLYKEDSNTDRPNRAWREYWPSTQAYRRAIIRATKLMGVDAEPVLLKITDTDVNVPARITMAQALLERPYGNFQTYGGRVRPPQLTTGK
jgi:hypothetical protein